MGRAARPHVPDAACAALADRLVAAHGAPLAFVVADDAVWFATGAGVPWTPVLELVIGVREACVDADFLLRRRIYAVGGGDDPVGRAVVQVAARRLGAVTPAAGDPGAIGALPWRDARPFAARARDRARAGCPQDAVGSRVAGEGLDLADALGGVADPHAAARERDRPIGAVLVDGEGTVLAVARNQGGTNRALHAEVSLVQGWWTRHARPLPAGSTVLVSLQPCRMCAALLVAMSDDGTVDVVYRRTDPGRLATHTALSSSRRERQERGRS